MQIEIKPSTAAGIVNVPASKSAAHRLMICAGLAKGSSTITNLDMSQDIQATLDCLSALGASWSYQDRTLTITGCGDKDLSQVSGIFPCNECGSTIRFFVPICLLSEGECTLTGTRKLLSRPMQVYEDLCKSQGLTMTNDGQKLITRGRLSSGHYEIAGNISSQFITGLLFALPLLSGDSVLHVTEPFESRPYVDMTIQALTQFGIRIRQEDSNTFLIEGGQTYQAGQVCVEGDWSNAAFLYALQCIQEEGENKLTVAGVDPASLQGDKICIPYMKALKEGCPTLDLTDCPDLAPVLFALAGRFHGAHFTGTRRLAFKESDRVQAMAEELKHLGVTMEKTENTVTVHPASPLTRPECVLSGHNDHRIVMALATLLTLTGGSISGAQAVAKSYPTYFQEISRLGIQVTALEE